MAENYTLPQNSQDFLGEFIVFFSDVENPDILFHSIFAEDAYAKAEEILKERGQRPTIILIEEPKNNIAQLLTFR